MPYVYSKVTELEGLAKVGTLQCVALVQHYANVPHTSLWRAGADVFNNLTLAPGTAIATFVDGRYPNLPHGNHAAFFLKHGANGFWIMDQWADARKKTISSRPIFRMAKQKNGAWPHASNNANAFSVIEHK